MYQAGGSRLAPVRLVGKAGESDEEATDDSLAFLAAIDLWSLWSVSEGRFTGSDGFAPSSSFTPVLLGRRDVSFARAEVDASLFADPATPFFEKERGDSGFDEKNLNYIFGGGVRFRNLKEGEKNEEPDSSELPPGLH